MQLKKQNRQITPKVFPGNKRIDIPLVILMTLCSDIGCDDGIDDVEIPCNPDDFGQMFVRVFIAKPNAASFASTTDLADQSVWDTRLGYDPTGANAEDRIVSIGEVHDGRRPAAAEETEEGPYGGDELVTAKHMATWSFKRLNAALMTRINSLRCQDRYKFWYVTDTGWVFGGVDGYDASIMWGFIEHAGPGQGRAKTANKASWRSRTDEAPVYIPTLRKAVNP